MRGGEAASIESRVPDQVELGEPLSPILRVFVLEQDVLECRVVIYISLPGTSAAVGDRIYQIKAFSAHGSNTLQSTWFVCGICGGSVGHLKLPDASGSQVSHGSGIDPSQSFTYNRHCRFLSLPDQSRGLIPLKYKKSRFQESSK
jgi:hypothetical protein